MFVLLLEGLDVSLVAVDPTTGMNEPIGHREAHNHSEDDRHCKALPDLRIEHGVECPDRPRVFRLVGQLPATADRRVVIHVLFPVLVASGEVDVPPLKVSRKSCIIKRYKIIFLYGQTKNNP